MMKLSIFDKKWEIDPPFIIAGQRFDAIDTLIVEITSSEGVTGRAETVGVDYLGETVETMRAQIDSIRAHIERGISRIKLLSLLPAGGARNGVDLALWDLESRQKNIPVYRLAGLPKPKPVPTAYTIGIMGIDAAKRKAKAAQAYPLLKVKVDRTHNIDLLSAIRRVRPDAKIVVDANQSWDIDTLQALGPKLEEIGIEMLEQPFAIGQDANLDTYTGALALMADESCQSRDDFKRIHPGYTAINIKLDKTGGLTEALELAKQARKKNLKLMVGNMCGSSLAMAPAFLLAQICDFADLDGPLLQTSDCPHPLIYNNGHVGSPATQPLWGGL